MGELISGYIDIHAHILPGLDDGAKDIEETCKLLEEEVRQGVHTVIATPHYMIEKKYSSEELQESLLNVQQEIIKRNISIEIHSGNEILYQEGCVEAVKQGEALTLAKSRYVLVEFFPEEEYQKLYDGMKKFILKGYLPILAHLERYSCLAKRKDRIDELISLGCYMQMNCFSLMGGTFDRFSKHCRQLVSEEYVHFLSSDCHNMRERRPLQKECREHSKLKMPDSVWKKLLGENAVKILDNKIL